MKFLKYLLMLFAGSILIYSCGGDPDNLVVTAVTADGTSFVDGAAVSSDLNGASSAEDVALNAVITVTFDKEINAATSSNVSIASAGGVSVSSTVTSTATTMTIDPSTDFQRGTAYTLTISGLTAVDEGVLSTLTRTFTTEGRAPVVVPNADNQIAYWSFDGSADDVTGDYPASDVISVEYGVDRFGQPSSTATFDGDESIIVIPDADRLLAGNDFTMSLWLKTNNTDHVNANGDPEGHFVLGLAAFKGIQFEIFGADHTAFKIGQGYVSSEGVRFGEDAFFNGNGQDKDNGGWQGWDFVADLTSTGGVEGLIKEKWAHIIVTYDSATKLNRLYINGQLMKGHDFNLWPEGDKMKAAGVSYNGEAPSELPELAFGFVHSPGGTLWDEQPWGNYDLPTSKHFKGDLDDVRFFNASFTPADAKTLYDSEKQ